MIRFASLGSGSRGNALVVESGETRLLIDCGFGPRETAARLSRLGLQPEEIDAVLVTHEHGDHIGGVASCAARYGWSIHATHGTVVAGLPADHGLDIQLVNGGETFAVGALHVQPFPVPHDAREPVQYVLSDGAFKLGVLTDIGEPTPHVAQCLSGCHALVLECNHDRDMLMRGSYPPPLKRRIAGRLGHLANDTAADLLAQLDTKPLRHLVAAHLSEQNNDSALVRRVLAKVLDCEPDWIGIADQAQGFSWRLLE